MAASTMPTTPPFRCNPVLHVGLATVVMVAVIGCGRPSHIPELGYVSGTVMLDGRPFAKANVAFEPGVGRPSLGITDAQGRYALNFVGGYDGALLGRHTVRIGTEGYFPAADGSVEFVAESVPAVYNKQSTLTADVQRGRNRFDFELSSQASPPPANDGVN